MKIEIDGFDTVIKRLEGINEKKFETIFDRVVDAGVDEASLVFASAKYDGIKDDIEVSKEKQEYGADIIASGNAVAFIEFGSGVHYQEEYPNKPSGVAPIGTYGKGYGSRDWWIYEDNGGSGTPFEKKEGYIITHGNPPAKAMISASKEMKKRVGKITREELRKK